jgi:hypothetical protein
MCRCNSCNGKELSQPPLLLFPFHKTELFKDRKLGPLSRNIMSDVEKKEYLKSAKAYEQPPWELHKASLYLRKLVACNDAQEWKDPPVLDFVRRPTDCNAAVRLRDHQKVNIIKERQVLQNLKSC